MPFACKVMLLMLLTSPLLHAADPFLGKWVLDAGSSKYPTGLRPAQMTIEMTQVERGVHYHSETRWPNGAAASSEYTADYDGRPAIVAGDRGILLPVSLTRAHANLVIARYTQGVVTVATSRRTVSADGRLLTITTTSGEKSGRQITTITVLRRSNETVE